MNRSDVTPLDRIWQLGLGFANTAVLRALVTTGVIEEMRQQPRSLVELAQARGLNPDMLYRVLRYAAAIGIVEPRADRYALTEVGNLLLKDVPGSIYLGIQLFGGEPMQRGWQNLDGSLVHGGIPFEQASGASFFEYLERHPELGGTFHQWMTVSTQLASRGIAEAYDFSAFHSVCDVGGGQGILLKSILAANPHLHGILYDQATAVKDHVLAGMDGRVEIQTGSFFDRVPAADVLVLKSVLHDWDDDKSRAILNQCRQSMQPGSRLLIVDRVIQSPADVMGAFFDLHMLVLAGGRERTADDFRRLLQQADLRLLRILPTPSPWSIVEAAP